MLCTVLNSSATRELITLSLHDALPICAGRARVEAGAAAAAPRPRRLVGRGRRGVDVEQELAEHDVGAEPGRDQHRRSEEHTSELQSRLHLVCRLLPEKKKATTRIGWIP